MGVRLKLFEVSKFTRDANFTFALKTHEPQRTTEQRDL